MDLNKLDKQLGEAQKNFGSLIADYHNVMLNPKLSPENQTSAIKYYTEQIILLLGLIGDFSEHYRSRPVVNTAILEHGLKISDRLESLLHQQTFEKLLEDIDDNDSKIGTNPLLHSDLPANKSKRGATRKTPKLFE